MKWLYSNHLLPIFLLLYCSSCYKISTSDFIREDQKRKIRVFNTTEKQISEHFDANLELESADYWLYKVIPRHRSQVYWFDLPHWISWSLFGNDDDGIFGESITAQFNNKDKVGIKRAVKWGIRNPLHNFTFYTIGQAQFPPQSELTLFSAAPDNFEVFKYTSEARTVFASKFSSFYLGLHGWKPFISTRVRYFSKRQLEFYVGWRERGNFGIKFIPWKKYD